MVRKTMSLLAIALAAALAAPLAAQEWQAAVLKARSIEESGSGEVVIELASGATIRVPAADWSSQWSQALDRARRQQELEEAARSSAEPPSDEVAAAMIRSHCADEWPDDFQMRDYCEDQQREGLRALRARSLTGSLAKIRTKCADEWPDDFQMRDYCEEQQIEALRRLNP